MFKKSSPIYALQKTRQEMISLAERKLALFQNLHTRAKEISGSTGLNKDFRLETENGVLVINASEHLVWWKYKNHCAFSSIENLNTYGITELHQVICALREVRRETLISHLEKQSL